MPKPQKRSRSRAILYRLMIVVVFLVAVEIIFRAFGYEAGYLGSGPFGKLQMERVDSLEVRQEYYVDEDGMYRADPQWIDESYAVLNESGFRSIPFDTGSGNAPRILWLGDSFTWGASATPLTESFVDLVARDTGWQCFNAGIPGAGPNHYARNAELLIPKLRPDAVCVVFYMANDILYTPQPVIPDQPPFHITNAGWLSANMDGQHFPTAESAYEYLEKRFSIPPTTIFNKICSLSATTTQFWRALSLVGWVDRFSPEMASAIAKNEELEAGNPVSVEYLREIKLISEANGAEFYLFVIQVHSHLDESIDETHPGLFGELDWHQCANLEWSDYHDWPNGHFQNSGHRKFAEFAKTVLEPQFGDSVQTASP